LETLPMPRGESNWRLAVGLALIAAAIYAFYGRSIQRPEARFGYEPDPAGVAEFMRQLPQPFFRQAGADCMAQAQGRDTFLYRSMAKAHKARYGRDFVVGRQEIGSCVAWGAMHAVYCAESVSWDIGEIPEPPLMPATAPIYGGSRVEARQDNPQGFDGSSPRGGFGDGSYGAAAARWLRDFGVVYATNYPGLFDYTVDGFKGSREKEEGAYGAGGKGDNYRVDALSKKHPCKHVVKVSTWEELSAAIEAGFPVTVASGQGFSSRRSDGDGPAAGISEASGSWAHQMVIVGLRHKKNGSPDDLALILNSWGPKWNGGGKFPSDQPDGSFWARRSVVERMIRGDSWAIGRVDGFRWKDIHHGNWFQPPVSTIASPKDPGP
jgi:hypothetical protein